MTFFANLATSKRGPWLLSLSLLLLAALLYLPYLGEVVLHKEETRRALIAEHMMQSGDYWVPVFEDRIYTAKPPLYNWVIAFFSSLQGQVDEFSARVGSVLSLMGTALMMVLGMRRYLSLPGLAFVGMGTLFAAEMLRMASTAEIDTAFTALVTASIWSWFWLDDRDYRGLRLWLLPGVLAALAFLTKREPALVFYYFTLAGYLIYRRRFWELFHWSHLLSAAVTLGLIGLWLLMMVNSVGWAALVESSLKEVVSRGVSTDWGHYLEHILLYPFEIWVALLPFALFLLPLVKRDVRSALREAYPRLYPFVGIAVMINLPIYLFRADVAVRYYMPMMPTLVVLGALVFEQWRQGKLPGADRLMVWSLRIAMILASITAVIVLLALQRERFGMPAGPADILPTPLAYSLALAVLVAGCWILRKIWQAPKSYALGSLLVFVLVLKVVQLDVLMPRTVDKLAREENFRTFAGEIYAQVGGAQLPIQTYGWIPHGLWYAMDYGDVATVHRTGQALPQNYFVAFRDRLPELAQAGLAWKEIAVMSFRGEEMVAGRIER